MPCPQMAALHFAAGLHCAVFVRSFSANLNSESNAPCTFQKRKVRTAFYITDVVA